MTDPRDFYTHILWDWNGTLLCDVDASLGSVNRMFARRGLPQITLAYYQAAISLPIRGFYETFFDLDAEDYNALLLEYNENYEELLPGCGLTPGVREVLARAHERGIRQAIVSSSESGQLLRVLSRFEIADYFDAVLGAEHYFTDSKIERARAYLQGCGDAAGHVLAIGDLRYDAEMAEAVGADCILLTSGHHGEAQFQGVNARIVGNVVKILEYIS